MRPFLPLILAAALLLSACSSTHSPSRGGGKYFENDGPPTSEEVGEDAIPRVEPFKAGTLKPYQVLGKTYVPITEDLPMTQTGVGSWYGKQFHGKRTATGETYNMFSMSAAHPTMPLPSYAEVTNLDNGKSVIVRVNDRGPFLQSRVIDLSYAAAKRIGYAGKGTGRVRVRRLTFAEIRSGRYAAGNSLNGSNETPLATPTLSASASSDSAPSETPRVNPITPLGRGEPASTPVVSSPAAEPITADAPTGNWGVQIGFFSTQDNAQAFLAHAQATLGSMGRGDLSSRIVRDNNGWRVILGRYANASTARSAAQAVSSNLGISAFPIQR